MIILVHIYDPDDRIIETNVFVNKSPKKAELMSDIWINRTEGHLKEQFWKYEKVYCDGKGAKFMKNNNEETQLI